MLGLLAAALALKPLPYTGTNLSGAEFGPIPGAFGKAYTYPTEAEVADFVGRGMNVFRVPFRWERLQPVARGPLDGDETGRLRGLVRAISARGAVAILDPHDYARRADAILSDDEFADLWARLAAEFKGDPRVWFGLMNEPHDLPTATWLAAANAALAAIRRTGARNLVLVPGNGWTGAHSWIAAGNDLLLGIRDPADHYAFEAHQYLDRDSSGTHPEVVSATIGVERLRPFVEWCRKNRKRGFLGEFGVADGEAPRAALEGMLASMERDRDVWLGFTWWSAGPWWGDYMFSIEPKNGRDRPQMAWLRPHLQAASPRR